jgi:hypothetical protein
VTSAQPIRPVRHGRCRSHPGRARRRRWRAQPPRIASRYTYRGLGAQLPARYAEMAVLVPLTSEMPGRRVGKRATAGVPGTAGGKLIPCPQRLAWDGRGTGSSRAPSWAESGRQVTGTRRPRAPYAGSRAARRPLQVTVPRSRRRTKPPQARSPPVLRVRGGTRLTSTPTSPSGSGFLGHDRRLAGSSCLRRPVAAVHLSARPASPSPIKAA